MVLLCLSCALLLLLRVERNDRPKNKKFSDYHKKIEYILHIIYKLSRTAGIYNKAKKNNEETKNYSDYCDKMRIF